MRKSTVLVLAALAIGLPGIALADGQGAVTGAAGGAVAGAVVGGPVGAAIGGVGGAVIGGAATGPGPVVVQPVTPVVPCDSSTTVTTNGVGAKSVTQSTNCPD